MSAKIPEDDPDGLARVDSIIQNPSYRQADVDVDFLAQDKTRGIRLQLDFFKAESLLAEFGIKKTIVVFGSSRTLDPETAAVRYAEIKKQTSELDQVQAQCRIDQAEKMLSSSAYYVQARELGRLVGRSGEGPEDCRLTLMTGGGPGIMEAANRGAYDVGAKSVGLNISLPFEQFPNPYVTPDLCFQFHYFAMRKLHFMLRAKALVAFPGGFGTLDELFGLLTLTQTGKIERLPIILVGEKYWRKAIDFDFYIAEGVINEQDKNLVQYVETADAAWQAILKWYQESGEPLLTKT